MLALGLAVIVSLLSSSTEASKPTYIYTSLSYSGSATNGLDRWKLDTSNRELIVADAIDEVHLCERLSKYFCFYNAAVSFYVPTSKLAVAQTWSGKDAEFKLVRFHELAILGQRRKVAVILAMRANRTDTFYYSADLGLLGIKIGSVGNEASPGALYLLEGMFGFPRGGPMP